MRHRRLFCRHTLVLLATLSLGACGGGGDNGGGTANRAPTANAGTSLTVVELTAVQLNGSGSDADGDVLTFAWSQTAGPAVVINNANMAQAGFTAPDVAPAAPQLLTFRLTVSDTAGLSGSSNVNVTVQEPAEAVTISGIVDYEFPPPNTSPSICTGLNFDAVQTRPIRRATVQILQSPGNTVLGSMLSSDTGAYSFTVPGQTDVFIRVRAELKPGGAQSWDVEVRDNFDTAANRPLLNQRPLYVLQGSVFNSGGVDSTRNLTATTGWSTASDSYTGVRAAAPFAILDTIYTAMSFVAAADPTATFPPLDAYWSINNNTSTGTGDFELDVSNGDIGTSFFLSGFDPDLGGTVTALFLLGMEGDDTEEFDDHVIAHEWGHYFEDKFSRSDSIGGSHGLGDLLDMRVAFGEGWATALSGIALDNPNYCDTLWSGGNLTGFRINIEGGNTGSSPGWYNEFSILKLIYDLWDTNSAGDGTDTDSIGFGPIYEVMTGPQSVTPAFTSVFTFGEALKNQGTGKNNFIDSQLVRESINAVGIEPYGSTETNNAGGAQDVFPVYTAIPTNGTAVPICSNSQFDGIGANATGNKLSEHRFLRMNVATAGQYTFTILTDSATLALLPPDDPNNVSDQSDPDIYIYRNGTPIDEGVSGVANQEIFTTPNLAVGNYVMDFHEFRYEDTDTPAGFPLRACFTIQVSGP